MTLHKEVLTHQTFIFHQPKTTDINVFSIKDPQF